MSNKIIQVAVIDDNEQLRYISVNQLETSGYIVQFQVNNGQNALKKIEEDGRLPDVCIVEGDFGIVKLLLEKHPNLKVLFSSTDDHEASVTDTLKAGVSGYALKYADPDEIVTAVKALAENGRYFSLGISGIARAYFIKQS
ncbi:response regulator [Asinibacterium sp. OR53]|uniref:response regulator n=1 Tax=Asinibacterium sp. OR53 TaxID=925409 RepID=UPI00055B9724|nr:response regulator [Asinibacterium sp. OR53]